jgi:hypothetical protein
MNWKFDQGPKVACITSSSIMAGASVLSVTHYEDDHSWAFLDGQEFDPDAALVVSMSEVIDMHPDVVEIADLEPGWTATRASIDQPWVRQLDDFDEE